MAFFSLFPKTVRSIVKLASNLASDRLAYHVFAKQNLHAFELLQPVNCLIVFWQALQVEQPLRNPQA
ncbi:MAG: hypothetical protein ACKPCM_16285 [Pseudanabaena sp.]